MLQVRKLVLAVAAATSMASGMAHALGLGEISIKSALNEPLVAEIELLETRGLSAGEVRSQLASAEDFSRAGVDRQFFLNNLKFTPVIRPDGRSFVRVTSNQAVREPFLNFVLEVYWPAGRVLKEYTLLLDPPMYTPQEVVYQSAPVTAPAAARTQAVIAPAARPATVASPAPRAAAPALQGGQYRVQKNDTLWEIAQRAGAGGSVHQVMLAIQDLNPDAFIDGNINRLKAGQVLKLPDAEQVRQRNRSQAVAEFQAQVDAWKSGATAERQLDARHRETAAAAPAQAEQGDSLRLVAAETGEAATGSDSGAAGSRILENQLALTKEQLDSTKRENEDLASRVEELNSQVEKLQRLLELKNTELANLQTLSEEGLPEDFAVASPPADDAAALAVAPTEDALEEETAVAVESQPEENAAMEAVADAETETATAADEAAGETVAEQESVVQPVEQEAVVAPVQPEVKPEPKPAPVAYEPPPAPKSFFAELKENPLFLPGAGAGAALLLLLLLLARRKKAEKQEVLPPEEDDMQAAGGMGAADTLTDLDDMLGETDIFGDDLAAGMEEPAEFVDVPATEGGESDPIAEAENYISFGRFNQASDVLLKAIDADPQREDLRFKLLEVYADLEDRNAFLQQVDELNAMGVSQSKLDELRQRFPHLMGEDEGLSLDEIMLDLPGSEIAPSSTETPDLLADDIPGLDDLLGETSLASAEDTSEQDDFSSLLDAVEAELDDSLKMDDTLDLGAGLELDSGLDEGFELPAGGEQPVSAAAEELELDSFELPEIEDFKLEDFDLPAAEDSNELSLDDLQLDVGGTPADTAELSLSEEPDFGLDLDLSLPLEEPAAATELEEGLETADLEAGLDALEKDFDALQEDVQESLQANGQPEGLEGLGDLTDFAEELSFETPEVPSENAGDDFMLAELEQELDEDFGFLQGDDEDKTKLDLASAWIDMGDIEGAREILEEVIREGAAEHQEQARELLAKLG